MVRLPATSHFTTPKSDKERRKRLRFWLKNLAIARAYWLTVPEENITPSLCTWGSARRPACNTIACFGGWCTLMPEFLALGVVRDDRQGNTVLCPELNYDSIPATWRKHFGLQDSDLQRADAVSEYLFGNEDMFMSVGTTDINGTDHARVLHRIDTQTARLHALLMA